MKPIVPKDTNEARQLAERFGLAILETVSDEMLDPDQLASIPLNWAREQRILPVVVDGENCLLVADPMHIEAHQRAAQLIGSNSPLRCLIGSPDMVASAIERAYATFAKADASDFIKSLDEDQSRPKKAHAEPPPSETRTSDLLEAAEDAPAMRLANLILLEAVKQRASDIHFEPFEGNLQVRYRIDGVLYRRSSPPKHMEAALISRLKVMARLDIAERRLPQDGMAQVRVGHNSLDIRVSTIPVADGERVVLRLLNRADAFRPLGSLGMDENVENGFQRLLGAPNGMIIVSGPTGSGKTTTLYAALGKVDAKHKNILTIEDPIEYRMENIGQIQVKPKIGLTFANGLRHILRQDPDVILVGETRDDETADIAVRSSLTGHLVLTTLHTNTAASAVVRLVDMGIEPYLLAASLRGVLGQRLLRNLCPHCRQSTNTVDLIDSLNLPTNWVEQLATPRVWQSVGCDNCLEGYTGRSGVYELMLVNTKLQNAIRTGAGDTASLEKMAIQSGMRPLLDDALRKVSEGVTDLREVAEVLAV